MFATDPLPTFSRTVIACGNGWRVIIGQIGSWFLYAPTPKDKRIWRKVKVAILARLGYRTVSPFSCKDILALGGFKIRSLQSRKLGSQSRGVNVAIERLCVASAARSSHSLRASGSFHATCYNFENQSDAVTAVHGFPT